MFLNFYPFSSLLFRENMPSHFKFKEYCPLVFRNLRERFNIDDQDFQVGFVKEREMIQGVVLKPQHVTAVEPHKTPVYSLNRFKSL